MGKQGKQCQTLFFGIQPRHPVPRWPLLWLRPPALLVVFLRPSRLWSHVVCSRPCEVVSFILAWSLQCLLSLNGFPPMTLSQFIQLIIGIWVISQFWWLLVGKISEFQLAIFSPHTREGVTGSERCLQSAKLFENGCTNTLCPLWLYIFNVVCPF